MDIKSLLCNTNTYSHNLMDKSAHANQEFIHYNPSSKLNAWTASKFDKSATTTASSVVSSSTSALDPSAQLAFAKFSITNLTKGIKKNHQQTRTPWTSKEDLLLKQGYLQGLSWAMISAKYLPHRSRGCCWGRFKTLQAKSAENKGWSDVEDRLLLSAIRKHTRLFKQAWRSVALDLQQSRDWKECEIRSTRIQLHDIVLEQEEPRRP